MSSAARIRSLLGRERADRGAELGARQSGE